MTAQACARGTRAPLPRRVRSDAIRRAIAAGPPAGLVQQLGEDTRRRITAALARREAHHAGKPPASRVRARLRQARYHGGALAILASWIVVPLVLLAAVVRR